MENSSIQPSSVLTDYPSVGATIQQLSDDDLDALCDEVIEYLFVVRPAVDEIAAHFAQFFRHAADRDPALAKRIAAVKMAAFTNAGGAHYAEKHEAYLTALSGELVHQSDYRAAFEKIGEAIRSGALPPSPVPEVATPES
jgi:hypothetical protein